MENNSLFGFIDESGAPGIAMSKKDCFAISIVIFDSKESCNLAIKTIEEKREKLKLPENYEFHCSSNSIKIQEKFIKAMSKLNFQYISIVIHKDKSKQTASYAKLASISIAEIQKITQNIKLEMDDNPILYKEFRKIIRAKNLNSVKIRERKSYTSRLIQVADYIVNISSRRAKNVQRAQKWYKTLKNKEIIFIEL